MAYKSPDYDKANEQHIKNTKKKLIEPLQEKLKSQIEVLLEYTDKDVQTKILERIHEVLKADPKQSDFKAKMNKVKEKGPGDLEQNNDIARQLQAIINIQTDTVEPLDPKKWAIERLTQIASSNPQHKVHIDKILTAVTKLPGPNKEVNEILLRTCDIMDKLVPQKVPSKTPAAKPTEVDVKELGACLANLSKKSGNLQRFASWVCNIIESASPALGQVMKSAVELVSSKAKFIHHADAMLNTAKNIVEESKKDTTPAAKQGQSLKR